jgi:polyferredoxin
LFLHYNITQFNLCVYLMQLQVRYGLQWRQQNCTTFCPSSAMLGLFSSDVVYTRRIEQSQTDSEYADEADIPDGL